MVTAACCTDAAMPITGPAVVPEALPADEDSVCGMVAMESALMRSTASRERARRRVPEEETRTSRWQSGFWHPNVLMRFFCRLATKAILCASVVMIPSTIIGTSTTVDGNATIVSPSWRGEKGG